MCVRGNSAYFADNSRNCRQILMSFFEGWDISLVTSNESFDFGVGNF